MGTIKIQNDLSMLIQSAIHHEVFTAGALEARVRRKSAFRAPADECFQGTSCENRVMYSGLYQHMMVVLYLLYSQPKNILLSQACLGRSYNQLVVPKELGRQVMSVNIESAFSGHLGAKKTEVRILPNFFWP